MVVLCIPHGDHNHYIKVQTKGWSGYWKTRFQPYNPIINLSFWWEGSLGKVDQLLADSRSIYKDKPIDKR